MLKTYNKTLLATALSLALVACSDDDDDKKDSRQNADLPFMSVVGTYVSGNEFDSASAEIVSYDSSSDKLYVVNAEDKTVDVLSVSNDAAPTKSATIDLSAAAAAANIEIGAANSVVARNGIVAVAIEAETKQDPGIIALYSSADLSLLNTFTAGALPDMVTMTEDGNYIVVANEGEPNGEYTVDPEGSVTIINISEGTASDKAVVTQVDFTPFNSQSTELKANGVRLPAPYNATVAQDLEPEFITITTDNKAIVALQENNAFAKIDIASATVEEIKGLGVKRWDQEAGLDVTNKDEVFAPATYPQLVGYYMPDSITSFNIDGQDYILSANEGDAREYVYDATQETCDTAGHEWDGDNDYSASSDEADPSKYTSEEGDCISYVDEARGKDLNVADAHPLMDESVYGENTIANKDAIGRIKVVLDNEDIGADDDVYTFGARSFSIWNASSLQQVYDSGDDLATIAAEATGGQYFNASNDAQVVDDRSDDKGIEPEAIEVAVIEGITVAFIGLERQGGIAAYDVSNPEAPVFIDYLNNRDFTATVCLQVNEDGECDDDNYNEAALDLGPESIEYFSREGAHFIAVGNEVSGTTTVYALNSSALN